MMRCGLGVSDCTPRVGLPMQGNYRDDYAARGVHDPLLAHALVVANDAGQKIALLSIDVCLLGAHNVKFVRDRVAQATDIRPDHLLVAATHTHSGPALTHLSGNPLAGEEDVAEFLSKAADAVVRANESLAEGRLIAGTAQEERVSFNRRLSCSDGTTHMNWEGLDPNFVIEPRGPTDPQLVALGVESEGSLRGAMVNFALHAAVLAGDNWLYSADFPGYLRECLRTLYGEHFLTAFFNGCAGNINHIDYADLQQGRGFKMNQRIGYILGAATYRALRTGAAVEGQDIRVITERVPLERLRITDKEHTWARGIVESTDPDTVRGQVDGLPDLHYAKTLLRMREVQDQPSEVEVMSMRIGNLALAGLPSEIFSELGLSIKAASPAPVTGVFELSNDWVGYMPAENAFDEGGYESRAGSTRYVRGSGEKLAAAAIGQLQRLFAEEGEDHG